MSDIYGTEGNLEAVMNKLKESNFSNSEEVLLREFVHQLHAENISDHRVMRYVSSFITLQEEVGVPVESPNKSEILELVGKINKNKVNEKDYSPWTKAEFKKALKKFYTWFDEVEEEELLDFMSTKPKKSELSHTDPADLPQPSEVRKIQKHATNARDKAFVAFLWESGGRIGEVMEVKWKDLEDAGDFTRVRFRESKTQPRSVPIKESVPALNNWKLEHPDPSPENYVFTRLHDSGQLSYNGITGGLERAAGHAEPACDTNPHAFRKSRATYLASKGFNVFQLMSFFGWKLPETALTYVRMAQSDIEDAFLEVHRQTQLDEHQEDDRDKISETQKVLLKY